MSYIPKEIESASNAGLESADGILQAGAPPFVPKMVSCGNETECFTQEQAYKLPAGGASAATAPPVTQVTDSDSLASGVQQPSVAPTYQQTGSLDVSGNGKKVNQIAYAALAFLLGGLGVHKFYAGKIGMGILYLVFSWTFIPELIGVIEAIIAFTKKADADGNIIV